MSVACAGKIGAARERVEDRLEWRHDGTRGMKFSSLAPQGVRAIVSKLRFARRNAGFVPTTVTKTLG